MKEKILVAVIDAQKDFVNGVLGTQEAQVAVPKIAKYLDTCEYDVVFTQDTHNEDYLETQEGKKLPVVHCVKGTDGWKIVDELQVYVDKAIKVFEKPVFGSVEFGQFVKDNGYTKVIFVGFCTGICVLANTNIARAFVPELQVEVIEDLCACVTPDTHKVALDAMRLCQVDVI